MDNLLEVKLNKVTWIALLRQAKIQDATFIYVSYMQSLQEMLNDKATDEDTKKQLEDEIANAEKTYIKLMTQQAEKFVNARDFNNAAICYCELFKYKYDDAVILLDYANCLESIGQYDLQSELLEYAKGIIPFEESALWLKISENYDKKGDLLNAIKYREKYLKAKKKIFVADYNTLGDLYNRYYSEHTDEMEYAIKSLACFKRASDMCPNNRLFAKNATIMAGKANQFDDYKTYWERMLKIDDMTNDDKFDYACFCLKSGNLEGWYKYVDARFDKENNRTAFPKLSKPYWNGITDISNSTLLVHYEQGFGDSILFSGYIRRVQKFAKHVIFVVQEELYNLMKLNFPDIEVYGHFNANLAKLKYDYYIPSMSIPKALNLDISEISVGAGYLKADEKLKEEFKEKYFNTDKLKIGISFSGNATGNLTRDIPLEAFLPLDKFDNIQLYCVTKGLSDNAFKKFKNGKVINVAKDCDDFADTAAAIANCDLVITADNVILNLAGALGVKTFGVFNWSYEFRWFDLKGDNVRWYTSVKPFVNEKMNDWLPTIKKVIAEVLKMI